MRSYIRTAVVVGICLLTAAVGLFTAWQLTLRRAFPRTAGVLDIEGVSDEVEIYRDRHGVAHIFARNPQDLYFAQGFTHAQDRFWQMEFWRRIGSGRLSELFGEKTLASDIFLRALGFRRVAELEYGLMDKKTQGYLDSYTAGVNAYIGGRKPAGLGLEFMLLEAQGVEVVIEPWKAVNSLTWAKVMAFDLGANMGSETLNIDLVRSVGIDRRQDYFAPYRASMPLIVADDEIPGADQKTVDSGPGNSGSQGAAAQLLASGLSLGPYFVFGKGSGIGSNSWVVSGALTSTGKPILANDTHLAIQMPSIWYEIGLHYTPNGTDRQEEALNVRGFSFPGVPGVVIGQNERIAWGFTNIGGDVQDYYIERLNPANPDQYEVNGEWQDMDIIHEKIEVHKRDAPYELRVRSTRHGPILSDHGGLRARAGFSASSEGRFPDNLGLTALSLRWPALELASMLKSIALLNRARNFDDFHEALRYWHAPSQNAVYADIDGNIGYQTPGLTPIRLNGDGLAPVPGWNDEYEWVGYVPYDRLPKVLNPPKGYIVTANNPIVSDLYPYGLGSSFDYGGRADRIVQMIEERKAGGISVDDVAAMQGDSLNPAAVEVLPYLANLVFQDPDVESARDSLMDWDRQMKVDSAGAPLFAYFWRELVTRTFKDQYPQNRWPGGGPQFQNALVYLLNDSANPWWDDIMTPHVVEKRNDILVLAFEAGYRAGVKKLGKKLDEWKWGDVHRATFKNQTLGKSGIKPLEWIFNRGPVATRGGNMPVSAARWNVDKPFEVTSDFLISPENKMAPFFILAPSTTAIGSHKRQERVK